MTDGNILKSIWRFAAPCILTRVLQNLYTLVDSVIVGWAIDQTALAAVGATGSLISLFTDTIIGLMSGFSVVAGKRCGEKNEAELRRVFANSLLVTFLASAVITVGGFFLSRQMLTWMKTPEDILDAATRYLQIIFLGIATSVVYNFLCEMLRALGNSREPLIFLVISSVVHILLILLFTGVWGMGVEGAALSTVLSQLVAALLCVWYIVRHVPDYALSARDMRPSGKTMRECLHIGVPMAVTNFVVMFGGIILSFVTNKIGTEYVAVYSTASRVGYIVTTPIFGFATAVSVFASQNLGAGKLDRVRTGVKQTIALVTGINVFLFLLLFFTSEPLIQVLMGAGATAIDAGVTYLRIRCTAMFVLTLAAVYKNVLNALGRPLFPTISGFLEIGVRYIIPLVLAPVLGFLSVPLTDAISWLMLAVFLMPAYFVEVRRLQNKVKMPV